MLDEKLCETTPVTPVTADPQEFDASSGTPKALGRTASAIALAGAVAACGGGDGSGGGQNTGGGGTAPGTVVRKPDTDAQAARFVLRASLSTSKADIDRVKSQGYEPWLNARMDSPNDQTGAQFLAAQGFERVDSNEYYNRDNPGDSMVWSQLLNGGNGVRKRAALALSEFFVVSLNSIDGTWRSSMIAAYWDILNRYAFGNYRDLLEAITLNPAMGVFLNTRGNRAADAASGRVPDENYGREVMQLFSIGLFELNRDGTSRAGSDGKPIETYDNDDVTEIAKAFTGYDFDFTGIGFTTATGGTRQVEDAAYARAPMTADPSRWRRTRTTGYHSTEAKSFLGTTIPANTSATETLRLTLNALFNHANVGPFLGKQMIQRLVTSNPSPAYVDRVASAFNNNGAGVRGDLRAMFKAVLLDDEALSDTGLTDQRFGKLREPMVRYAQWARTFDAQSASGKWEIGNLSDDAGRLGQSPLRSPSVFNFFRPGYVPLNSQAAANGLVAPEMQITNETSVAGYVNFMERIVDGSSGLARDVKARYTAELPIAHDAQALLDHLDLLLTGNQLAADTRATILAAMQSQPATATDTDDVKLRRIHTGVFLVMISNDYQVQR